MTQTELAESKIVILSHYATTGACEELRDWLHGLQIRELVYVALPFGTQRGRAILVERYIHGAPQSTTRSWWRWHLPEPLAYAKDFLYALIYSVKYARKADVIIAGDNLLTLAAIATRWLTGAGEIVYYMIDYSPVRYANKLLNAIYYLIDRMAAQRANMIWPLTDAMIRGRFEAGRLNPAKVRWQVVPYGSHPMASQSYDRRVVVYMGDIIGNKGVELFVPMAQELQRLMPDFKMVIIGGGKDLPTLRSAVATAGLTDYVEICGFVRDMAEVLRRLANAAVAIAPYSPHDKNSFTFYADPGKIKVYLGCGLPIVLTNVPPIAHELEAADAGRVVAYDALDFATAVAEILQSNAYTRMRANAAALGEQNAWPRIFARAFAGLVG